MKRLLMIAFHYPPASGTSGVQRALKFSSHLPEFGWEPIVLTANARAHEHRSDDLTDSVPREATVIRAAAWDTRRHFSIRGRYPTVLSVPDRWWSWLVGAVPAGIWAIRKHRPDAIWSTYPIATAHRIGTWLARLSGLPYVADFRDPMAQVGYPEHPVVWRSFANIEARAIEAAAMSTFTTPSALELYQGRYPMYRQRMQVIENGYDEEVFAAREDHSAPLIEDKITLLHSGIVYPSERDPNSLFAAIRCLRSAHPEKANCLRLRFRAPMHVAMLQELTRRYGLEDLVQILPPVSYAEAIREMRRSDGLLILQASNCNAQIPAKFYEYLRCGPPLLVVTDPAGDTASAARAAGVECIADFGDPAAIAAVLERIVSGSLEGMVPRQSAVLLATRRARTVELVGLLDRVCGQRQSGVS